MIKNGMKSIVSHVTHKEIPLFINEDSHILILGSMPSVASRAQGFFYAHPQNRFFKTMAMVFNEQEPKNIEERKTFHLKHRIALYDVIHECDICGSSDSSIKNVVPIDIKRIITDYPNIKRVYTTGKKAKALYDKYLLSECHIEAISLPSTSPANATISIEKLVEEYRKIID